jgi:acrylyl-CoA reductase (NADPH)
MSFKALLVDKHEQGVQARFVDLDDGDLMEGDVTVRVTHSTVNYKDGLVMAGRPGIVQRYPMVAGVDFSGIVESSGDPRFRPGDEVLVNGFGLSQTHFGGYAGKARVPGDWLSNCPKA